MKYFLDSIFFSYSQIFFSNRRWFGVSILFASFISIDIGMMALLGVLISNSLAIILKFDKTKIKNGFYGFNGILFGSATAYYYEFNFFLLLIIIIFIALTFLISTVLENYLATAFNLPGLSLPFVLTIYLFIIFLSSYNFITLKTIEPIDENFFSFFPESFKYFFHSIALIIYQPNIITGILITLAILFFSRVLFVLSITAFIINFIFLQIILPAKFDNLIIISSFNSILTAFALGGSLIIPSKKSFVLVIISSLFIIIFTGIFSIILSDTKLPILVLPFNFIVLTTVYGLKFRQEFSDLVLLYFIPGSPEENFYYHQNRKSRFDKFKNLFAELPFFGEWFVSQSFNGEQTHKDDWKHAWDFVVVDNKKSQYSDSGDNLKNYYCYKLPIASPLDGEVMKVIDGIPNNKIGEINIEQNWGNTIIISHGNGLYSSLSHLEPSSIKVKENDKIKKGDIIAICGNSGRSPFPHIHFQFQLSDKLGDKTYQFPIAHYIEMKKDCYCLKTFDYPEKDVTIQNVEIHKSIKKAFDFKVGDKLKFDCIINDENFSENWEIKLDIYNNIFIESSQNDIAIIYKTNKVFYFTSYIGKKHSALYYFYLLALQIPMSYHSNLKWQDEYSLSQLPIGFLRYISEFFLFIKNFITAKVFFNFEEKLEDENNFVIKSMIQLKGENLFSAINKIYNGKLVIAEDGSILEFTFTEDNRKIFQAKKNI